MNFKRHQFDASFKKKTDDKEKLQTNRKLSIKTVFSIDELKPAWKVF